jgi:DNA-binding transcriptional MerR regulator
MKDPDISEVARQSGLPASTLRYYEEKGLVASNGRRGLKRTFDPGVFEKLGLIALGRAAGFTLDEICRDDVTGRAADRPEAPDREGRRTG